MRITALIAFLIVQALFAADSLKMSDTLISNANKAKPEFSPKPSTAALLSTVLAGAGQTYNRKYWKAPVPLALEATLLYYALDYNRQMNDLIKLRTQLNPLSAEYAQARKEWEDKRNSRNILEWSILAAHLLNILDAYIDAQLYDFDKEVQTSVHYSDRLNSMVLTVSVKF
jgi:hypothetical protein